MEDGCRDLPYKLLFLIKTITNNNFYNQYFVIVTKCMHCIITSNNFKNALLCVMYLHQ